MMIQLQTIFDRMCVCVCVQLRISTEFVRLSANFISGRKYVFHKISYTQIPTLRMCIQYLSVPIHTRLMYYAKYNIRFS